MEVYVRNPGIIFYGLIVLAIDHDNDFPIDYNKSLGEVQKDTILLKAMIVGSSQEDVSRFGQNVRTLLGGGIVSRDELDTELIMYTTRQV